MPPLLFDMAIRRQHSLCFLSKIKEAISIIFLQYIIESQTIKISTLCLIFGPAPLLWLVLHGPGDIFTEISYDIDSKN